MTYIDQRALLSVCDCEFQVDNWVVPIAGWRANVAKRECREKGGEGQESGTFRLPLFLPPCLFCEGWNRVLAYDRSMQRGCPQQQQQQRRATRYSRNMTALLGWGGSEGERERERKEAARMVLRGELSRDAWVVLVGVDTVKVSLDSKVAGGMSSQKGVSE